MAEHLPFLRFAIVATAAPGLTRWQIHKSDCDDVSMWIEKGAVVEFVVSRSTENLIAEEIAVHHNKGANECDFQIMACCWATVAATSISSRC
jgi:hypothetical protein